jgi:hypothetical protein
MSGFSYFAIGFPTVAPLPIELISFQANCSDDNTAIITWSTASEHNSSYFQVEKSRDGINWIVLSEVGSAGNSTSLINYELFDTEKIIDVVYYRLTQFDFDGASETFNIASIDCGSALSESLKVYPNPSVTDFYIDFNNTTNEKNLTITITDLTDNLIYTELENCEKGSNNFHIKALNASPGIYFIEVTVGDTVSRVKHCIR